MKAALIVAFSFVAATCLAADGSKWSVGDEDKADFAGARECQSIHSTAGPRKLWVGKTAYYIQAWIGWEPGQPNLLDETAVSTVYFSENTREALEEFAAACR